MYFPIDETELNEAFIAYYKDHLENFGCIPVEFEFTCDSLDRIGSIVFNSEWCDRRIEYLKDINSL